MATATNNRRKRRKRDWLELGAMLIAISLMVWMTLTTLSDENQLGSDRTFLIEACVRLNVLRAEDNVNHFNEYRVFRVVLVESLANEKMRPLAKSEKANAKSFLAQLKTAVDETAWTPLTDCQQAVNTHGARYSAPGPILFIKRFPSRYDLYPPPNSAALRG